MACDHIVARYGQEFVTLSKFPLRYKQYNEAVDAFNKNYSQKKGSRAIPPPIPLSCFPCCMGCGHKLDWEKIRNEVNNKTA